MDWLRYFSYDFSDGVTMAGIQFVGLPTIVGDKLIKCGYVPNLCGGADWYVVWRSMTTGTTVQMTAKDYISALRQVEELARGFRC